MTYTTSLNPNTIETFGQKGLKAIQEALFRIDKILEIARHDKAKQEAQVNNLIFLYGQTQQVPILNAIKPYYGRHDRTTPLNTSVRTFQLTISGVRYWLNYRGQRFGALTPIHVLDEQALLAQYFDKTAGDSEALGRALKFRFIGGILNTPIFAFRARYNYSQRGKKYYIDLADHKTYTRLHDAKQKAEQYSKNPQLLLIRE